MLSKLFSALNRINKDKYQHFAVGAVLAAAVLLAACAVHAGVVAALCAEGVAAAVPVILRLGPLLLSFIVVLAVSIIKERIDPKGDLWDILATLAGGAVVWAVALLI